MSDSDSIVRVHAREVLDSRGHPTVEAEVTCAGGAFGRAIAPSGASTGRHEAKELRDGDAARYGGKGVRTAAANARDALGPAVAGLPAADQQAIDARLRETDGTPDKSRLGANAVLAVSLACAHAAAAAKGVPLWRHVADLAGTGDAVRMPMPMVNMISGGLHAGGNLDVQDVLLVPVAAKTYSEALEMTVRVYRALARVLAVMGYEGVLVGDEGGFGPRLENNRAALLVATKAIEEAGLRPGADAALALDVASTHFYKDGRYVMAERKAKPRDAARMVEVLTSWADDFPLVSIEDGLAEDDWDGWKLLTDKLGGRLQLIGDDLFVTSTERLRRGVESRVANAVLVKLNQVGTLTETLELLAAARAAGYRAVISARSGETEDSTMADLAVGTGAGQIKIGSVARSERLAKYNQLLRIEEQLGAERFAGWRPVG